MVSHKDLFSSHAEKYSQFRPGYPEEIFAYLANLTPHHQLAWDCATGNGQAAVKLAQFFDRVVATDLSQKQLDHAKMQARITYQIGTAESCGLKDKSVDLITAAQAFHWFDQNKFAKEVRRVGKEGAILALWCYGLLSLSPTIDPILAYLYNDILGPFWEPERKLVDENYNFVVLPFHQLKSQTFQMSERFSLARLLGYLATWSSWQAFINKESALPLQAIELALTKAFGKEPFLWATWQISPKIWQL